MAEPSDAVVARKVQRDRLVSFKGRRYSVPFAWVGRQIGVWGTLSHIVIRAEGDQIVRHARGTRQRLLTDPRALRGALDGPGGPADAPRSAGTASNGRALERIPACGALR